MELYYVTVDFMTTPYILNIKLSDKFNTKIFAKICKGHTITFHFRHGNTD